MLTTASAVPALPAARGPRTRPAARTRGRSGFRLAVGKPSVRPRPAPRSTGPGQRVGPAQEGPRLLHVAVTQGLADRAGRHGEPVDLQRREHVGDEAVARAQLPQEHRGPARPAAEGVVEAHHHLAGPEGAHQRLVHEGLGFDPRELQREGDDQGGVEAVLRDAGQVLLERRDGRRAPSRASAPRSGAGRRCTRPRRRRARGRAPPRCRGSWRERDGCRRRRRRRPPTAAAQAGRTEDRGGSA